jgi:hypothetical protein
MIQVNYFVLYDSVNITGIDVQLHFSQSSFSALGTGNVSVVDWYKADIKEYSNFEREIV